MHEILADFAIADWYSPHHATLSALGETIDHYIPAAALPLNVVDDGLEVCTQLEHHEKTLVAISTAHALADANDARIITTVTPLPSAALASAFAAFEVKPHKYDFSLTPEATAEESASVDFGHLSACLF